MHYIQNEWLTDLPDIYVKHINNDYNYFSL